MQNNELYKIANIIIKIQSDLDFPMALGEFEEFIYHGADNPDYQIEIIRTHDIGAISSQLKNILAETPWSHFFTDDKGILWELFFDNGLYYAALAIHKKHSILYHLGSQYLLNMVKHYKYNPLTLIAAESILIQFNTVILHSCHIQYYGKSILFTAPSGVGKSTQGALWEEYLGAEVINGDRTAINHECDVWTAYGIPMCGTSEIHLNKNADLAAIIVLEQADENKVIELSSWEKFQKLYSQITVYNWNREFCQKAMDIAEMLTQDVPVYLYQCTKEPNAAYDLYRFLKNKGVLNE